MNSHTDERRTLIEFGDNGNWKLCKVVEVKKDCILGKHYHKEKDESFMLVSGSGTIQVDSPNEIVPHIREKMKLFKEYFVPANMIHEFSLTKNSILIGLCSKEFDPKDDYQ